MSNVTPNVKVCLGWKMAICIDNCQVSWVYYMLKWGLASQWLFSLKKTIARSREVIKWSDGYSDYNGYLYQIILWVQIPIGSHQRLLNWQLECTTQKTKNDEEQGPHLRLCTLHLTSSGSVQSSMRSYKVFGIYEFERNITLIGDHKKWLCRIWMDRMINLIKTDKKNHLILIRFINTCSNLLIT